MTTDTSSRLRGLRTALAKEKLTALLVTSLPNVRYLSGFSGSAGAVLVDRRQATFVTDFRYRLQASSQVSSCRVVEQRGSMVETVALIAKKRGLKQLAFESRSLTVATHGRLKKALPGVRLVPAAGMVERLRMIKDPGEIALLRRAVGVAGVAYRTAARILAGRSERHIATALETAMRRHGAEDVAFPPIVASGRRGALPHATPGGRRIGKTDLVTLDFGARYRGYHSDITRSRLPGGGKAFGRKLYRLVAEAQRRAMASVAPGVKARDVDEAARRVIDDAGYGACFGHGTGHGVGLEVHEGPTISPRSGDVLAAGMVFTVEPGIYVENFGGLRIEDMVLVTQSGCEILSRAIRKAAP